MENQAKDILIEQLQAQLATLSDELIRLNKRKMARNSDATNKWRNKAFYYKKRYGYLLKALKDNPKGLEIPKMNGGNDESLCKSKGWE